MAKQDSLNKNFRIFRGQEVEGKVVAIYPQDIVIDLGIKSEGTLPKKEFSKTDLASLKIGGQVKAFVQQTENESGQVILGLQKPTQRTVLSHRKDKFARKGNDTGSNLWKKFREAMESRGVLKGTVIESNKGGVIVEVLGMRGFLPSSQMVLSQAADSDKLLDKEIQVIVIELDPQQNRLIFAQQNNNITEDIKHKLSTLKPGDIVTSKVSALLPFGIFLTLHEGIEGLVHLSEASWDKQQDVSNFFKIGDAVSAKILSIDPVGYRVNLSIKQAMDDPFDKIVQKLHTDDMVKGKIIQVSAIGVTVDIGDGIQGLIRNDKLEGDSKYQIDQEITCLVDSIDKARRRISLVPFLTTTKGLIYK